MTWNEYQRRVNAYNLQQWRQWEHTRQICVEVFNSVHEKQLAASQYLPLPTDAENATTPAESDDAFWARMQAEGKL